MQITEFEVDGCKRIKLNGTRRVKLTLSEIVQVILGTNGCGKSSLMRELTPLPANKNDYHKDGSKTITIIDGQDHYVLRSWFNPSQRHSFVMNGVELNGTDGGTAAQQKDLVRKHFRITEEIRDLLTGKLRFSRMDTAVRRKWMMMLSEGDYDFALAIYAKLKTEARDIEGALKHVKKRLATESEKVIKPEEEKLLNNEVNQIHRELNLLMEVRAPVTHPSMHYKQENDSRLADLNQLAARMMRMKFVTPYSYHHGGKLERDEWGDLVRPHYTSIDQVDKVIDEMRHDITSKETLLNSYVKHHTKATKQLETLAQAGEAGMTELREQAAALSAQERDTLDTRRLKLEGTIPRDGLSALATLSTSMAELLDAIPSNPEQEYSQAKMVDADQQCIRIKNEITEVERKLKAKIAAKDHMEQHKGNQHTQCPKCSHRWNLQYDEAKFSDLMDDITELDKELGALRREYSKQESLYETNRNYGEQFRSFHRVTRSWTVLNPFWDYVTNKKLITENPRQILRDMLTYRKDLEIELEAAKFNEQAMNIRRMMVAREELGDLSIAKVRLEVEEHATLIEELTSSLNTLQMSVAEHQAFKRQLQEMQSLGEKITNMRQDALNTHETMIEMMRRETIQQCIRQLQGALARKEEVLAYKTMVKATVDDLQDQVYQLEVQHEAAELLVQQLSPNKGLIADGLVGFINSFLKQMNALIRRVWAHGLVVHTCVSDTTSFAELDYKFPVQVQGDPELTPDVFECSTGEVEIIDLAFRIGAMSCLGLMHGPLYLDEFAASFAPEHRHSAIEMVTSLMETKPFTQLFMISHYEESYTVFNSAEFCVLSPQGITVPGHLEYNKHVQIN